MATIDAIQRQEAPAGAPPPPRTGFRIWGIYMAAPTFWILIFFAVPMLTLGLISLQKWSIAGVGGFAGWSNYISVFQNPSLLRIVNNTVFVAAVSMVVMLFVAIPLGYLLAFRVPRFEFQLLLLLVLSDQLNPLIRIYAWQILLGRNGVINSMLTSLGLVSHPVSALLFSKTAVIIVLTVQNISYATIPIYAAMKAVDISLVEAADDLGASFATRFRKILIPLAAPGIIISIILVGIPLLSEFVAPALVGGPGGYMLGNAIEDQILLNGNWGVGSAMSFMLLVVSAILAFIAYRVGKVRRLETLTGGA